jgi:transglutaminase-like putative cysteine protease
VSFVDPVVQRWQMGVIVKAGDGAATGITVYAPIPTEWPEQQVKVVGQELSAGVRVTYRDIPPGARQMVVSIPRLAPGDTAQALLTFEVTRSAIAAPADTGVFVLPSRRSRELAPFLGESPKIESRHPTILKLAEEVTAGQEEAWPIVEAIYSYMHKTISYKVGELKGALETLADKEGDCEACTSLFVALCRARGIPARTVWVAGHSYSEFYLEDGEGAGHWIPCQSAGSYRFGSMDDRNPIMQKGDNFRLPGYKEPFRYAQVVLTARDVKGRTQPSVEHVQRQIETPAPAAP